MPDTYTHPSGYCVERDYRGVRLVITSDAGNTNTWIIDNLTVDALRDYLLDELGLWRDNETGALVVIGSWDGSSARVIALQDDGVYAPPLGILDSDAPDRYDAVVTRWRASITPPPPREPKPGEVWRVTRADGTTHNAVVLKPLSFGLSPRFSSPDGAWPVDAYPADRRRLLAEADGTVVSDE